MPDHRLHRVPRQRRKRHRHVETTRGVEPEIEILAQQLGRERDAEVEVHECRRLVARERRAQHALVHEVEEGVPRDPCLLRKDRDLGKRLRDDAEEDVVADLDDARELALADVARRRCDHLQVRKRGVECGARSRAHERQPAGLDDLRVAGDGSRKQIDAAREKRLPQLGRSFERNRRTFDDELRVGRATRQQPARAGDDFRDVLPCGDHHEHDVARREVADVLRDLRADLRERLGLGARAVPHGEVRSALGQPLGHRVTHAAHADPADAPGVVRIRHRRPVDQDLVRGRGRPPRIIRP